ncbi:flavodoxin domain-containing protein [Lentzea sp. BCCO 10_0798]|uniref:Flavodoxin domain-containing protein n=1 Tax=Lentzea kristufekii TaxID=3095430 RepID=A0ABU4TV32_9PSEU|nr:flavodoxin domain-containing protein [Lentzea sp. BCCO 10_0798]MDX8052178.1 flavodoxin domain-containing protein [Lentzea sp. BCCO 10_0798]
MKVLVGFATAAGSTEGVAQRIAGTMRGHGHEVETRNVDEVSDVHGYDAFVLGSAVHNQAWLPNAAGFLSRERQALARKPVWLFSVGLPGALRGPVRKWAGMEESDILAGLADDVRPLGHQLFTGVVTPRAFGRGGAVVFRLMGGRFGDFRDWAAIDVWANQIAEDLTDTETLG